MVAVCKNKVATNLPSPPQISEQARVSEPPRETAPPAVSPAPAPTSPARPAEPDAATKARIQDLLDRIQDAYFDYDKHDLRADAQKALARDAQTLAHILNDYPAYKLTVEGY